MDAPPANAAPPRPLDPRRRILLRAIAIGVPLALIAALLVAVFNFSSMYLRYRASRLGVSLAFDEHEVRGDVVTLRRARAGLSGVDGLTITAASVKLTTKGTRVTSVEAAGVVITLEGSATDRVLELSSWSAEHPDTYRLRGAASDVRLAWTVEEGAAPWLTVSDGSITSDGKSGELNAGAASVGGVALGKVSSSFTSDATGVRLAIGKTKSAEAPITARLTTSPKPPRVDLALRPVKLESLSAALGLALPAPGATAQGRVELTLGKRGGAEAIEGRAELTLDGYLPPHPRELGPILAGKKTALSARVAIAADRSRVTLSEVITRAGKLELKGAGAVVRAGKHATLKLDLRGPIACADLARSAAKDRFGLLGELVGDAASSAVAGTVTVDVTVEADSRDLRAVKVKHRAGVGCGLKVPGF